MRPTDATPAADIPAPQGQVVIMKRLLQDMSPARKQKATAPTAVRIQGAAVWAINPLLMLGLREMLSGQQPDAAQPSRHTSS